VGVQSYKSIGAVAVILFASAMMGIGVHHLLDSGTCSTTGFTRYGPAPRCSSSSTAWAIVLPIGVPVIIVAGTVGAMSIFVVLGPLFVMFGLGALTVGSGGGSGVSSAFPLIFGGAFTLAGAGLLGVPACSALSPSRRSKQPEGGRTGGEGGNARIAVALAAWVAALAAAAGVASWFPSDHTVTVTGAGAAEQANAFFQPPALSATDPSSLFRTVNFTRTLAIATTILGTGARVRSVLLVPGGADVSVALGPRGLRGRDVSIDDTGGDLISNVVALSGSERTGALSGVDPSMPAMLVSRLGAAGRLTSSKIDHMLARPGAGGDGFEWLVYPAGGGLPYRAANGAQGPITVGGASGTTTAPGG
jgi:hypothetical protein